eukprot:m.119436 g.119436  ORF g.119436 m.119436 type:complete len:253 (-) comp23174_c0_seq4:204-962(-)
MLLARQLSPCYQSFMLLPKRSCHHLLRRCTSVCQKPTFSASPYFSRLTWCPSRTLRRSYATIPPKANKQDNMSTVLYATSVVVLFTGFAYAAVPLYRMFCQATGFGGTIVRQDSTEKIVEMEAVPERTVRVKFNADTSATMQWGFFPQQKEVTVIPGETALAFFTAKNPTDEAITGISTYNVIPYEAGQYFNKIQCFCFEEQRLNPNEEVDMPVFFYIDPEFAEDPLLEKIDEITLSYTFWKARKDGKVPVS